MMVSDCKIEILLDVGRFFMYVMFISSARVTVTNLKHSLNIAYVSMVTQS